MTREGVLFVGHGASRTGAPIALLHFLEWFKKNGNRPFALLLPSGGELVPELREVCDTWALDESRWCPGGLRSAVGTAAGFGGWVRGAERKDAQRFAERCKPGLIYANSISSAPVVDVLALDAPVLAHVHELEFAFRRNAGPALRKLMGQTSRFIACSEAVREHLVEAEGKAAERVEVVHESIPVAEIRAERAREHVLAELGLPADALLVAGSGTPDWRKGADLFLQLARMISRQRPRVCFAWVGGGWTPDPEQFEHDIRKARLADKVRFTGAVLKPADYIGAADVFVLTSREDPYPLVCLEAAALGKPIVCFDDAGGEREFVESDCGFVVPYLDLEAMAGRAIALLDSAECREKMGAAARRKVAERHDVSVAAPRIMEIIERTIADR